MLAKKRKGITLVEVLLAMSLLLIIFAFGFNILKYTYSGITANMSEYELQSSTRVAAQTISRSVKNSTAMFILPKNTYDVNNLSPNWDYIVIEETTVDGKTGSEIVQYTYDDKAGTHKKNVLVKGKPGVFYFLEMNKNTADDKNIENRLVNYRIVARDSDGNELAEQNPVESEVQALNSLQVIDLSTESDLGVGFAFSNQEREMGGSGNSYVGHIAMVLDGSGSMSSNFGTMSRSEGLRVAATQLLNGLAKFDSFYLKPIVFDQLAYNVEYNGKIVDFLNIKENYSLFSTIFNVKNYVNNYTHDPLYPGGSTNIGDGIRVARNASLKYNAISGHKNIRNYLILLTDGETNKLTIDGKYYYNYNVEWVDFDFKQNYWYYGDGVAKPNQHFYYNNQITMQMGCNELFELGSTYTRVPNGYDYYYESATKYTIENAKKFREAFPDTQIYYITIGIPPTSISNKAIIDNLKPDGVFTADTYADLLGAFSNIEKKIVEDLWFVNGPQISDR